MGILIDPKELTSLGDGFTQSSRAISDSFAGVIAVASKLDWDGIRASNWLALLQQAKPSVDAVPASLVKFGAGLHLLSQIFQYEDGQTSANLKIGIPDPRVVVRNIIEYFLSGDVSDPPADTPEEESTPVPNYETHRSDPNDLNGDGYVNLLDDSIRRDLNSFEQDLQMYDKNGNQVLDNDELPNGSASYYENNQSYADIRSFFNVPGNETMGLGGQEYVASLDANKNGSLRDEYPDSWMQNPPAAPAKPPSGSGDSGGGSSDDDTPYYNNYSHQETKEETDGRGQGAATGYNTFY